MFILSSIPGNFQLKMLDQSLEVDSDCDPRASIFTRWLSRVFSPDLHSSVWPLETKFPLSYLEQGMSLLEDGVLTAVPGAPLLGGLLLPLLADAGCRVSLTHSESLECTSPFWSWRTVHSRGGQCPRSILLGYPNCISSGNPAAWSPSVCSFLILIWVKGKKIVKREGWWSSGTRNA